METILSLVGYLTNVIDYSIIEVEIKLISDTYQLVHNK